MDYAALIFLIIVGIGLMVVILTTIANKKLKLKLNDSFGNEPANQGYSVNSFESYHQYLNETGKNLNCIDTIT